MKHHKWVFRLGSGQLSNSFLDHRDLPKPVPGTVVPGPQAPPRPFMCPASPPEFESVPGSAHASFCWLWATVLPSSSPEDGQPAHPQTQPPQHPTKPPTTNPTQNTRSIRTARCSSSSGCGDPRPPWPLQKTTRYMLHRARGVSVCRDWMCGCRCRCRCRCRCQCRCRCRCRRRRRRRRRRRILCLFLCVCVQKDIFT